MADPLLLVTLRAEGEAKAGSRLYCLDHWTGREIAPTLRQLSRLLLPTPVYSFDMGGRVSAVRPTKTLGCTRGAQTVQTILP